MAKFIIFFFLMVGSGVFYATYQGLGQEEIVTLKKEETVRSNSYRSGGSYSGSSYNSGGYSYGK
ncbi:hypothetical protein KKC13_07320 [bacterium]|nr:hypothetical protein [bacterium]MBU1958418.1 hypothetical protein [bacterium]